MLLRPAIGGFALAVALISTAESVALDRVVLERDGVRHEVAGKLLVTAADGGMLVLAPDGVLWTVQPDELVSHAADEVEFEPLSAVELASRLTGELPSGFHVHTTKHYLICHDTSKAYAQWCGGLLERLYGVFTTYWSKRGFPLVEPEFPLVAVIFADQASYAEFSRPELGETAASIIGYYSFRSNRMTMYDLTGVEALRQPGSRRGSAAQINQMLMQPGAERGVATIVHEATHQIAFNCGFHARYADIPLWVSEGLAVYFETPDLKSTRGWRTAGAVNGVRLGRFREYQSRRTGDSLASLIRTDERFRDSKQNLDAYAEAWALNYFLLKQHGKEYQELLKQIAEKKPFFWDEPQARLEEFEAAFGDLAALDAEFLKFIERLR